MTDETDALFAEFGDAPRVKIRRGVFASTSVGVAWVDMGESRFACDFGSGYIPRVGETVQVLTVNDRHLMFPARTLPGTGTVLTSSSTVATIDTTSGQFTLPYVGTQPTSGQIVGVSWSDPAFIVGVLSGQTVAPPPVPEPGPDPVRSATFQVIDTGSTDRGSARWWQAQPWASDSTYGAWFYGTQIRDTIPATAQMVSLEFYVAWQSRFGDAPKFALHNQATKGGLPTFGSTTAWAPNDGWQVPPMASAWFGSLRAGGGMLGVGLNQGGFNKFSSRAQNAMTGALRISWR